MGRSMGTPGVTLVGFKKDLFAVPTQRPLVGRPGLGL
jgi:hypothetical protein